MNNIQENIALSLKEHIVYTLVWALTILFFVYKGVLYLVLGSYIPIILISIIILLFLFTSSRSARSFRRMLGAWSILIMLWSSVRILLSGINQFIKPIPESHVSEQLGAGGTIFSLVFLIASIYLLIGKKRIQE